MRNLLILLTIITLVSCAKDDLSIPKVTIEEQSSKIIKGQPYKINYTIEDNNLESSSLSILDGNNTVVDSMSVSGSGSYTLNLNTDVELPLVVKVSAKDVAGNIGVASQILEVLSLEATFKVQYKGEDIEYLKNYDYVDGNIFQFSKIGFFISNLKLGNNLVKEVDYVTVPSASSVTDNPGYHLITTNVSPGNYNSISFNIGVDATNNAKKPSDFTSDNPLSKASEYWSNWNSYIFSRIEGKYDNDDNVDLELPFALHTGIDVALMEYNFDTNIVLDESQNGKITFVLDLYEVFNDNGNQYDLPNNRMLHSAEKLEAMKDVARRIETYLKIEE